MIYFWIFILICVVALIVYIKVSIFPDFVVLRVFPNTVKGRKAQAYHRNILGKVEAICKHSNRIYFPSSISISSQYPPIAARGLHVMEYQVHYEGELVYWHNQRVGLEVYRPGPWEPVVNRLYADAKRIRKSEDDMREMEKIKQLRDERNRFGL